MTLHQPLWLQKGTYTARNDRMSVLQGLVEQEGVVGQYSMEVFATTPASMLVTVDIGTAFVAGDIVNQQGFYSVSNMGRENVGITGASTQYNRIDLVILEIRDSEVEGTADEAVFRVIAGTPSASPTPPALPKMSIELARVTVRAGTSTITNNDIETRYRQRAILRRDMGGMIIPVRDMVERNNLVRSIPVSASMPLMVYRLNAPKGMEIEISEDGRTWRPITAKPSGREAFNTVSILTGNPTVFGNNPQSIAYIDIPDPGHPYYVVAEGAAFLGSADGNGRWQLELVLEKDKQKHVIDRHEPASPAREWQRVTALVPVSVHNRPLTGPCRVFTRASRISGTGSGNVASRYMLRAGTVPA